MSDGDVVIWVGMCKVTLPRRTPEAAVLGLLASPPDRFRRVDTLAGAAGIRPDEVDPLMQRLQTLLGDAARHVVRRKGGWELRSED